MKKLLVKLIGSGVAGDPYRAALPTYTEIATDYKAGTVAVEVPDDAICPCIEEHAINATELTVKADGGDVKIPNVITSATPDDPDHFKKWYDEHYKEHAGKFNVEFV